MTVRLRFFAALRERVGASEGELALDSGATVDQAWAALSQRHPQIAPMGPSVAFAVNREYVDRAHALQDGDELALIPPVSGGL